MSDTGAVVGARPLLPTLTGLRAIAATWVLVEHYREPLLSLLPGLQFLRPWIASGFLGVEVFFVLSGFVISYNYADRFAAFRRSTYRSFIAARLARLYPVHLVTLLVTLLLVLAAHVGGVQLNSQSKYSPLTFVANVVMLQGVGQNTAWDGPSWSISCEFGAYLAFPLIASWLVRLRRPAIAFASAAAWSFVGVGLIELVAYTVSDSPTATGVVWLRIAVEFVTGCLLFAGWRLLGQRHSGRADAALLAAAAAVVVVLAFVPDASAKAIIVMPLIGLFVLAVVMTSGPIGRILSTRVMDWAGRVSYSLYMTHFILLIVVGKLLPWSHFTASSLPVRVVMALAYLVLAYLAAALCYYTIERPGRIWVKRLLSGPGAARKERLANRVESDPRAGRASSE